jgi:hypothetical protein
MKPLESKNRRIIRMIGESPTPTILGLLPLDSQEQQDLLLVVRACAAGDARRLLAIVAQYPAAGSYAVTLALGAGATEATFWEPICSGLEVYFAQNDRDTLSHLVWVACIQLGLVVPDLDKGGGADRLLKPIIFQAGILPYWSESLAIAIQRDLQRHPSPDLADEDQVARFAARLVERVPAGLARLRRTLESKIGSLVCVAVLKAFNAQNFRLLPPHLQRPIEEAFASGTVERARSPFLRLEAESGRLSLVLPRQSSKLVSPASWWEVKDRRFHALVDRELDVHDLGGDRVRVRLRGLLRGFEDQEYEVKLAPDDSEPVFAFRLPEGRRVLLPRADEIELPSGDYCVLVDPEAATSEKEEFQIAGQFRIARVEMFPARTPLSIEGSGWRRVLSPRVMPEFALQRGGGDRLETSSGQPVYFGHSLDLQAYVPVVAGGTGAEGDRGIMFRLECPDDPAATLQERQYDEATTQGVVRCYDLTTQFFRPFLESLAAGIHRIRITGEGQSRAFSKEIQYWKGLLYVSEAQGFVCDHPPDNVDTTRSTGVVRRPSGLEVDPGHLGSEFSLVLKRPDRVLTLPKPGIWVQLVDAVSGERRFIARGECIDVNPTGVQTVTITNGGTQPWTARCGEVAISVIRAGTQCVLQMVGLLGQFGDSGRITAWGPEGRGLELFGFVKTTLARDLVIDNAPGAPELAVTLTVGQAEVREIEINCTRFSTPDLESEVQYLELQPGEFPLIGQPAGSAMWKIVTEAGACRIELLAHLPNLTPGAHFLDLRARKSPNCPWHPLRVGDKVGVSEGRLFLGGPPEQDAQHDWARMVGSVRGARLNGSQPNLLWLNPSVVELRLCLRQLQDALLFKYATPVWAQVSWISDALVYLCQDCFRDEDPEKRRAFAEAAVRGIVRRGGRDLSIVSTLVFGCQSRVMALKGVEFPSGQLDGSLAARSWAELSLLARAGSLRDYAFGQPSIWLGLFGGFENCHAVSQGAAPDFSHFRFAEFFHRLGGALDEADQRESNITDVPLLSPDHLASAIRALNVRFRPFESTIAQDDQTGTLARLAQDVQIIKDHLHHVLPTLRDHLNQPIHLEFSVPIATAESPLVQTISDALLAIAGLGRLCAAGRISPNTLRDKLRTLLAAPPQERATRIHRLCLLLSLAPELFAFYMLMWEAVLKPKAP